MGKKMYPAGRYDLLENTMKKRFPIGICSAVLGLLLGGCTAVGPNYVEPEMGEIDISSAITDTTGPTLKLEDLTGWWKTLNDPVLTELIESGVDKNHDLKSAVASLREARARLGIADADRFPTVDLNGGAVKRSTGTNGGGDGHESDNYNLGFDASWELDLFGSVSRSIEAAEADYQSQLENLNDVRISIAAEIALNYVNFRTRQQRLKVTQENFDAQSKTLEILQSRNKAGLSDELSVHQARYNRETTRSSIPTIVSSIEESLNALAILTGVMPGMLHEKLKSPGDIPTPSIKSVVGIPADFLRQRPDIRRAERELAAQTARIGVATADLYPRFTLNGSLGLETIDSADFLDHDSKAFSIGPSVSLPIFNAGSIRQNIEIQDARQEQYLNAYESAVLNAVKEVRDSIVSFNQELYRYEALKDATESAKMAVLVSNDQYKSGLIDFNNVLDAERALLLLEDELVISEGTITSYLIQLYKALGGGWETTTEEK